jgi:hypothetical protein
MASIQIVQHGYGITNVPTVNDTGIDFSVMEEFGFQYTGKDDEGVFCFVGKRGGIRCLADVFGHGVYQVRDQFKRYDIAVKDNYTWIVRDGRMAPA